MTTQPAFSHAAQMIPLAQELTRRDHQVAIATSPSFAPTLRQLGLNVLAFKPDWLVRPGDLVYDRTVGSESFFGFAQVPDRSSIAGLVDLARDFAPDLVVREYSEFSGWFVAQGLRRPLVTHAIIHRLPPPAESRLVDLVGRLAGQVGVPPPKSGDDLLGQAYLDVIPPSFRTPWEHDMPLGHPVRPAVFDGSAAVPPSRISKLGRQRPLVYVTLGTIFTGYPTLWRTLLTALSRLDVDAVVTTGSADPSELPKPPSNVAVERYIPQSQLLPHCSAVVCHAGFNTLIGAFVHGLPCVCLPLDADQPVNAARCAAAGAGVNLANASPRDPRGPLTDPETLSADVIVDAVNSVLTDPIFRGAARRLAAEIATMPGPVETVSLLEEMASKALDSV